MPQSLPPPGTRVSLRYRLPDGSTPPLTDVVGELVELTPIIRIRTKTGALVDVSPDVVVALRVIPEATVRTSQIRGLEYAAAHAWPGRERHWQDGWMLRYSGGPSHRANSAVPLDVHANLTALPGILAWYRERRATPWLAVPERVVHLAEPAATALDVWVLTTALDPTGAAGVELPTRPDQQWLRLYERDVDVDVLTAVLDGEVGFTTRAGAAVGRGAVTTAPDGTRWAGLAAVHVATGARRRGHARALCATLLGWAAARGATRGYVQVLADNTPALTLYRSMGFTTQHRVRYLDARTL